MSVAEAITVFFGGVDFDLVIICNSIAESQRVDLIKAIRDVSPAAKIIVIRTDGEFSAAIADETVHSLDGAEALLSAVAHALAARS